MKAALLPIAFALTAGAAFAQGPIEGNEVFDFPLQSSRADVVVQAAPAYQTSVARGEASEGQDSATIVASTLTRAQVRAEAAEAVRLDLGGAGEIMPVASAEQNEQIRLAGLRAAQSVIASN